MSGPAVVLDSTSPSYVGESTPSESSMESWWARVAVAVREANEAFECARAAAAPGGFAACRAIAIGAEAAELASSVRGSLSSSDLQVHPMDESAHILSDVTGRSTYAS